MIDILLCIIIAGLIIKSYFDELYNKRERREMVKAIMAKNLQEYDISATIDKQEPDEEKLPDEVPFEQADQSQFEKALDING